MDGGRAATADGDAAGTGGTGRPELKPGQGWESEAGFRFKPTVAAWVGAMAPPPCRLCLGDQGRDDRALREQAAGDGALVAIA